MSTQERRLRALEAARGIVQNSTDVERDHLEYLSSPSVLNVLWGTARITAERRWCFEHGRDAFGRDPWGGRVLGREHGWLWSTNEDTREALTFAEIERLERRIAGEPFFDAVAQWCDENDGLVDYWHATDATRFRDQLQRDRARMAVHRGASTPHAAAWRRQHPDWHPDMTDDEYDAWELEMLPATQDDAS